MPADNLLRDQQRGTMSSINAPTSRVVSSPDTLKNMPLFNNNAGSDRPQIKVNTPSNILRESGLKASKGSIVTSINDNPFDY